MQWSDEGYLLSKNNYNENSIIIEAFTLNHGKYTGVVYGGSSRKQKRNFQIGNKVYLNWKSKNENRSGYFSIELIKPVAASFFDDKKRAASILASSSILKILLPERQINKKIYKSFEELINQLESNDWIKLYIYWELSLIKELGYEIDFLNINKNNLNDKIIINNKSFKIPKLLFENKTLNILDIKEALIFNKNLLIENFILPNKLKFPLFRNILEKYYN
jgi:DNA repair protein RecO (recombination protein O)